LSAALIAQRVLNHQGPFGGLFQWKIENTESDNKSGLMVLASGLLGVKRVGLRRIGFARVKSCEKLHKSLKNKRKFVGSAPLNVMRNPVWLADKVLK
jgi:hypothetical protein